MKTRLLLMGLVALSILLSAKSASGDGIDFAKRDSRLESYGYTSRDKIWPDHLVSVCWETPDESTKQQRLLVEQSVEESWEAVAWIRFTGWLSCPEKFNGVRILIVDEPSSPQSLIGARLEGVRGGMRLNLTFEKWHHEQCKERKNQCLKSEAIHEFGHALGLVHESLRDDANDDCKARRDAFNDESDPGDSIRIATYDVDSIMNYCNRLSGLQTELSAGDKLAAVTIYGIKH